MSELALFHPHYWAPFASYGFTNNFWRINSTTVINTWWVLAVIVGFIIIARVTLKNRDSVIGYLFVSFVQAFKDLLEQSMGFFNYNHFCFITSLFTFIVLCNLISILPFLKEPTSDLSTTLALAITSFLYVQINNIYANSVRGYIKELLAPFFPMLPLHIVGLLAPIVSMSFRLFGNIFGGVIISEMYTDLLGKTISGWPLLEIAGIMSGINIIVTMFFIIFEGLIQAFVFSMLSLTYLSLAITHTQDHES